ncbi:MAG: tetratricopeptide repeat protein [bacterium]|nr:tetratricopeptide repeat protein [bacterium]
MKGEARRLINVLVKWHRRHHVCAAVVVIVLLTLAAYWPSFRSPFQFDDFNDLASPYFYLTPPRVLIQRYPTRWIPYLTLLANANLPRLQWGGWRPAGIVWFHLVNWGLHVTVSSLVYGLTVRMVYVLQRRRVASLQGLSARPVGLVSALLFGLHPMLAQTVIYLSQRAALCMAVCYMAMLLSAVRGCLPTARRQWHWLAVVAWLTIGLCCKETIVSAPLAVLWLLWLLRTPERGRWSWRRGVAWVIVGLAICALPVVLFLHLSRWHMPAVWVNLRSVGGPLHAHTPDLTRITYAITQITVVGRYLALALWPRGLSVDHDVPVMTTLWRAPVIGWGAVLLGLGLLAWVWRRRVPMFAWGYGFFLLALLPQSSFMPTPDLMLEYRTYPALAGVIWMGGGVYGALFASSRRRRWRWLAHGVCSAILAMFIVLTWQRSCVWRSEVSLWYDAWRRAPQKQRVANNLANALLRRNETDLALAVVQHTLSMSTTALPHVLVTLGNIYASRGELTAATNAYLIALQHDRTNRDAWYNLSLIYACMGLQSDAIGQLSWLAQMYPEYPDAWLLLGIVCADDPRLQPVATNALTRFLRLVPKGPDADAARATLERLTNTFGTVAAPRQ